MTFLKASVLKPALFGFVAFALAGCNGPSEEKESSNDQTDTTSLQADENNAGLQLPEGFSAMLVADELGKSRHIAVRENGDIYVKLSDMNNGGGIVALRDTTGDGKADIKEYFGEYTGDDVAFHNDHLYFSTDTSIWRYSIQDNQLVPDSEPQLMIGGFISESQHAYKNFAFDDAGNIYVNVGAPANACQQEARTPGSPGQDPCPLLELYGGIWRFKADQQGQTQQEHGHRYATGIRNAVAMEWNAGENLLYALQHGRDQLHSLFPEQYTQEQSAELPAEEFLLIEDGDDFGWPYCYYDGIQNKKVLSPEYGGDGNKTGRCAEAKDPIMAFPAHYAPNDLIFYRENAFPAQYRNGAFIAFHGSWNRSPQEQEGYNVVFVPFEGNMPSGDWEVFAEGFAGTETIKSPGDAEYRPMGLAVGPDGSLYISDSEKGRIWRVFYNSKS